MQIYICTCCYQEGYDTQYFQRLKMSLESVNSSLDGSQKTAQAFNIIPCLVSYWHMTVA